MHQLLVLLILRVFHEEVYMFGFVLLTSIVLKHCTLSNEDSNNIFCKFRIFYLEKIVPVKNITLKTVNVGHSNSTIINNNIIAN